LIALGTFWLLRSKLSLHPANTTAEKLEAAATPVWPARMGSKPMAPLGLSPAVVRKDPEVKNGAVGGSVLSVSSGIGVAGAEVTFARAQKTYSATCDANGNFFFAAPEPGDYVVAEAAADGYFPFAPAWGASPVRFSSRPGFRIDDVRIFLTPTIDYVGMVLGPAQQPVSDAQIEVVHEAEDNSTKTIVSDGLGHFHFHARDFDTLIVTHPQYAPGHAVVDNGVQMSHAVTVRLTVRSGAAEPELNAVIAGKVVDEHGMPLARAEVIVWLLSGSAEQAAFGRNGARSSDTGEFSVNVREHEQYDVRAQQPGLASAEAIGVAANTRDLVLRLLAPVGRISGVVRSEADHSPVGAFTILSAARIAGGGQALARESSFIDPEGHFEVDQLAVGAYVVEAVAYGFAPSAHLDVNVTAGQPAVLDIELKRGSCVVGTVVDARSQAPLAQARISVESGYGALTTALPTLASASTTADGQFRLCGLPGGLRSITIAASAHDARIMSGLQIPEDGNLGPLTVALDPVAPGEAPKTQLIGIGASLRSSDQGLVILTVVDGGGAELVDLAPGDIIEMIDGQATAGLDFQQAIELIRGPADTVLDLAVKKTGGEVIDINVPRRQIKF